MINQKTVAAHIHAYTTDDLVTELQLGQRNAKIMRRPTALAAMQKMACKSKSFSLHFEDLEASWVNVCAIINWIGFDDVFLTKKLIGLCYTVENYRFVLLLSAHSIYKGAFREVCLEWRAAQTYIAVHYGQKVFSKLTSDNLQGCLRSRIHKSSSVLASSAKFYNTFAFKHVAFTK